MSEQNMTAQGWLTANVKQEVIDGRTQYTMSARALWEWLEQPRGHFPSWWKDAKGRQKLKENKDFVCCANSAQQTKKRGGHNKKDYSLTHDAARIIAATDPSPRGRALLKALLDLADKIEAGDPELTARMNQRYREVHGTSAPGEAPRPWGKRLEQWFWAHSRLVTQMGLRDKEIGAGCWSVLMAIVGPMLALEDELIQHALPIDMTDRPDGSMGSCWANYRRKNLSLKPVPQHQSARLEVPLRDGSIRVTEPKVYPAGERATFDAWLYTEYLPNHLPQYLHRKYNQDYGRLPPASAADHLNLRLTNQPACLPAPTREALNQARRIRANGVDDVPRVAAGLKGHLRVNSTQ